MNQTSRRPFRPPSAPLQRSRLRGHHGALRGGRLSCPYSATPGRRLSAISLALAVSLATTIAATSGCALYSPVASLTVETPQLPRGWQQAPWPVRYRVTWLDPEGRRRELEVAPGDAVAVELPRLSGASVVITPVVQTPAGERRLKPGGALYSVSAAGGALEAEWWSGFEAQLYLELGSLGYAYFQLNQERLRRTLRERTGENPWRADYDRVRRTLLAGSFRASYLAPRDSRGWMAELPPGRYLTDRPAAEPMCTRPVAGRTFLVLPELYPGNHRYFHLGEDDNAFGELILGWDGEHEPQWRYYSW